MAGYANPGGGEEDMYSDAAPSKEKAPQMEEGQEDKTYVLPKAVLMGKDFEPGDEVVLRIVSMHGDSVEVTYAPEEGQEKSKSEGPAEDEGAGAPPQPPEGEMASMME